MSPAMCPDIEDSAAVAGDAGMEVVGMSSDDMDQFDFSVDDIDFGDFFLRLEDGDVLPDLEVDPAEIFTDFEAIATSGGEGVQDQEVPTVELLAPADDVGVLDPCGDVVVGEENAAFAGAGEEKGGCNQDDDAGEANADDGAAAVEAKSSSPSSTTSSSQEAESQHKSSSKSSHGKKKAKVQPSRGMLHTI